MKKSLYFVLAIAVAISGYVFWNNDTSQEPDEREPVEVVGMEFSEELVLKDIEYNEKENILNYELLNNTGKTIEHGFAFTLWKLQEDNTLEITDLTDDLAFIMMLAMVEPGKSINDSILFDLSEKTIEPGIYYVIREYKDADGNVHIPEVSFEVKENDIVPIK